MNEMQNNADYEQALQAASRYIQEGDDFLVISHVNPDGDAISSTCSIGWMLDQLQKKYTLVNAEAVPTKYLFLSGADTIIDLSKQKLNREYRYVICVDCADLRRIGDARRWLAEDAKILNIDHHPTNDRYGIVNLLKPDAASTTEVLFDLVQSLKLTWDMRIAECIYTGLLTDTGGFRYANTSARAMHLASQLLLHGIDPGSLANALLEKLTLAHIRILQRALANLSFTEDQKVAWVSVSLTDLKETGADHEDLEGLVNYPRNIAGVEVGLLFKQVSEAEVKVSFRSNGEADVSRIAQKLGGGGHVRASGATLQGELTSVIEQVVQTVKDELA